LDSLPTLEIMNTLTPSIPANIFIPDFSFSGYQGFFAQHLDERGINAVIPADFPQVQVAQGTQKHHGLGPDVFRVIDVSLRHRCRFVSADINFSSTRRMSAGFPTCSG
jgi:hypothetical protein